MTTAFDVQSTALPPDHTTVLYVTVKRPRPLTSYPASVSEIFMRAAVPGSICTMSSDFVSMNRPVNSITLPLRSTSNNLVYTRPHWGKKRFGIPMGVLVGFETSIPTLMVFADTSAMSKRQLGPDPYEG